MPMPIWLDTALQSISPGCGWTVTWPTRPSGVCTIPIREAAGPADAIAQARALNWPTPPGCAFAYDMEPCVWRVRRFGRSYHAAGPAYDD